LMHRERPERRCVGAQLVGDQQFGCETLCKRERKCNALSRLVPPSAFSACTQSSQQPSNATGLPIDAAYLPN
jgi:hypothetical protein